MGISPLGAEGRAREQTGFAANVRIRAICRDGVMAITYLIGDAAAPDGRGPGVIAHVCNDSGGWGKGFVLGMVQLVQADGHLRVANMVAQHGYVSPANPVAARYDALAQCLSELAGRIEEGTVIHMPRIGCGLAERTWDQIEPLLDEHLAMAGFDVRVYDLPAT